MILLTHKACSPFGHFALGCVKTDEITRYNEIIGNEFKHESGFLRILILLYLIAIFQKDAILP